MSPETDRELECRMERGGATIRLLASYEEEVQKTGQQERLTLMTSDMKIFKKTEVPKLNSSKMNRIRLVF